MKRFYQDINILDSHSGTCHAMTQLMSNLHRLLREHGISNIAVGFPEYGKRNSKSVTSLGRVIRLVSVDKDALKKITGNITFKTLEGVKVISLPDVKEVPEFKVTKEVAFYKDSRPIKLMQEHKRLVQQDPEIARLSYHDLKGTSVMVLIEKRGAGAYPIFVGRKPIEQRKDGEFNSYGFSTQDGPTFPEF